LRQHNNIIKIHIHHTTFTNLTYINKKTSRTGLNNIITTPTKAVSLWTLHPSSLHLNAKKNPPQL